MSTLANGESAAQVDGRIARLLRAGWDPSRDYSALAFEGASSCGDGAGRSPAPALSLVPTLEGGSSYPLIEKKSFPSLKSKDLPPSRAIGPSSLRVDAASSSRVDGGCTYETGSLNHYDTRRDVAEALATFVGLQIDGAVTWTVGPHTLSVMLAKQATGNWRGIILSGWPWGPGRSLILSELYATARTGKIYSRPGKHLLGRWKLWMLVDLGFEDRAPVILPELPSNAPKAARETWRLIHEWLMVRRITERSGEPFAFSAAYMAEWFRADINLIQYGRVWLEKTDYLRRVGEAEKRRGERPTILWTAMGEA